MHRSHFFIGKRTLLQQRYNAEWVREQYAGIAVNTFPGSMRL